LSGGSPNKIPVSPHMCGTDGQLGSRANWRASCLLLVSGDLLKEILDTLPANVAALGETSETGEIHIFDGFCLLVLPPPVTSGGGFLPFLPG